LRRSGPNFRLLHLNAAVRIGGAAVAGAELVLRVSDTTISLIETSLRLVHGAEPALPLTRFLVLDHLLHL